MSDKVLCEMQDLVNIADAVRSATGSTEHFNVEQLSTQATAIISSGGASVQSDWNVNDESDPTYVKNRTHWVERPYEPIVWDGSTEGRDSIDIGSIKGYPAGLLYAYKVSDTILTPEQIKTATVYAFKSGEMFKGTLEDAVEVLPGLVWQTDFNVIDKDGYYLIEGLTMISVTISGDFSDSMGVVVPSSGTYMFANDTYIPIDLIEVSGDTWHVLDKRYLPNTRWQDLEGTPNIKWDDLQGNPNISWNDFKNRPAIMHGTGSKSLMLNTPSESSGGNSLAEGAGTTASGEASHAEGFFTIASGHGSHAEGNKTIASGYGSHAEGYYTIASGSQHVEGQYNIEDAVSNAGSHGKYVHIVGNGIDNDHRSNAHTLDWNGVAWYQGGIKIGGTGQDDKTAVNVLTENDMDRIVQQTIAALPVYAGEVADA